MVLLLQAGGECEADRDRQAVTEGAGRGLDAGNFAVLGMAAEDRMTFAERWRVRPPERTPCRQEARIAQDSHDPWRG